MAKRQIRILLADDHTLFRRGLAQLLAAEDDLTVVGQAADGTEVCRLAQELQPDLILMDLDMPRCNGFEAISRILAEQPGALIVALTYSAGEKDAVEALRRGAQGYLLKDMEPDVLCEKIREAVRGESPIAGTIARKVVLGLQVPAPSPSASAAGKLTPREVQILKLVAAGATNKEIGGKLFLAENTVKNHLKHILAKLGVENRTQAVAWAVQEGVFGGPGPTSST